MSNVVFLSVNQLRGNVAVRGPITGLQYMITAHGTPVSRHDAEALLSMVGDPCCGRQIPEHLVGVKVKIFGTTSATKKQMDAVPIEVINAVPLPNAEPVERRGRKKRAVPKAVRIEEAMGASVVVETEEKTGEDKKDLED